MTSPEELESTRSITLVGIWTVHYRVRTDKGRGQPDKGLGSGNVPFTGDVTMPGLSYSNCVVVFLANIGG
jgi:hypothetical protein